MPLFKCLIQINFNKHVQIRYIKNKQIRLKPLLIGCGNHQQKLRMIKQQPPSFAQKSPQATIEINLKREKKV